MNMQKKVKFIEYSFKLWTGFFHIAFPFKNAFGVFSLLRDHLIQSSTIISLSILRFVCEF